MAAGRPAKVHPPVAPAGVCRRAEAGAVPVLGPSAIRGRPTDKKLPQPVVDGGLLVHRRHLSLHGAVYDGGKSPAVWRRGDPQGDPGVQRSQADQGPGPQGAGL